VSDFKKFKIKFGVRKKLNFFFDIPTRIKHHPFTGRNFGNPQRYEYYLKIGRPAKDYISPVHSAWSNGRAHANFACIEFQLTVVFYFFKYYMNPAE